jgi:hypothetical protein
MRMRAIVRMASVLTASVLIAVPIHGAAASKPARYSEAWLAQHHTQYDTTLTALYEAQIGYGGGVGSGFGRATTNIRMSNVNFAGNQNEFQIDINPTNHLFAIGASNDGRSGGTGAYRTSDGGKTWTATDMFPNLASCCDPGIAYAFDGTAYFLALDLSPAVAHIYASTDNGVTWTQKTDIAVEDRPNIVVDNGATSPHKGRVFVTWSDFGTTNEIRLYYSDNGGGTWTGPINVSHTNVGGAAYPQSSQPRVASDGTVYVGFQFYPDGTNNSAVDKVAKSVDGGATFLPATTITSGPNVQGGLDLTGDARGYFAVNSSCVTFRHRSFPIIGVDPTNSSIVYATWAGGNLETAYTCGSLTGVHSDILFSRSTNGGSTWSAPLKVNDDPPGHDQYYPWMDVAPSGKIWIGWHDRRDDASNFTHVYYSDFSLDGGLTFGVDRRIGNFRTLPASFIGDYAGLAAENDIVLPMWWDSRNSASGDPYTARIKG